MIMREKKVLESQKKIGGNHAHFSEAIKLQFEKKIDTLLCILKFLELLMLNYH